jgi:prepilin-type N-terminal cleavage/methylation domain-containing protein
LTRLKLYLKYASKMLIKQRLVQKDIDQGFSLIEVMTSITIMGIVLAYCLPVYMMSRLKIAASQRKSEALIVTQRIITNLERSKISDLPSSGTVTVTDPDGTSAKKPGFLQVGNRIYSATVTYCPSIPGGSGCKNDYKELKIEIKYRENFVYDQQIAIGE